MRQRIQLPAAGGASKQAEAACPGRTKVGLPAGANFATRRTARPPRHPTPRCAAHSVSRVAMADAGPDGASPPASPTGAAAAPGPSLAPKAVKDRFRSATIRKRLKETAQRALRARNQTRRQMVPSLRNLANVQPHIVRKLCTTGTSTLMLTGGALNAVILAPAAAHAPLRPAQSTARSTPGEIPTPPSPTSSTASTTSPSRTLRAARTITAP